MENNTIPLGRYRHYKGNEYQVLAVATNSETLEPMVVYQALYGDRKIWVRPASMWNEMVTKDGETCPWFTRISEPEASIDTVDGKSIPPIHMWVYRQLVFDAAMDLTYNKEPKEAIIAKLLALVDRPVVDSKN